MKSRRNRIAALLGAVILLGTPGTVWGEAQVLTPEEPEETKEEDVAGDTGASLNMAPYNGTILNGVYLENVNLSGMTKEQAQQAVQKRMEEITGYQILLRMDDETVGVSASELGVSGDNQKMIDHAVEIGQVGNVIKRYKAQKDMEESPIQLPIQYQAEESAIQTALEQYCVPLNREVVNYGLTRENGEFQVTNGQRGLNLNLEESVQAVKNYVTNSWKDGIGSVDLAVEITEPKGSQEELAKVKDVLGTGTTNYGSSSASRATNIKNGTAKLHGHVVYPGETFSVESALVPFTEENGYALAGSYANGSVVESFGGGICQVSTTLYQAVIAAELEVSERHNHSMIVTYVEPSMDAAIAEGAKDLKFVNNLEAPIYIEGYASGGNLSFAIYGQEYRPENRKVSFESETLETIETTTELTADRSMNFGVTEKTQSAHTGYRAKLWKIVTENGQEISREEFNSSYYIMTPDKYKVGVKTENAEAQSAMYAAIASNDLNEVYKVFQQYK